jgi:hypothetical protein
LGFPASPCRCQLGHRYTTYGIGAPAATGTESFPAFATTNFLTQTRNAKYISSATAGNACGVHETNAFLWRGDAAKRGGFFFSMRFGISTTLSAGIIFAGLRANTSAIGGTTVISTLTNIIGVCKEAADTTFQIIRNDASGTGVKEDTAITIVDNTVYRLTIFNAPGSTQLYISLEDLENEFLYEATYDDA